MKTYDMGFPRHIVALIQALYEKQPTLVRWNGCHIKPFFIEKGVRQGCILSPLLFCAYTEQVMREAELTESGAVIGGRSISNLRYADDTAQRGESPQEINNVVHKVNYAGRIRLLKLNARKTNLMVVGDENANVCIDVDGETIDKVNSFHVSRSHQDKHGQLLRRCQSKNRKGQESHHGSGYTFER